MDPLGGAWAMVRRELVSHLRQTRSFVMLAMLVGVACVVTIVQWPAADVVFSQAGQASRDLILGMSIVLLLASTLLMPAMAANSICIEREQETFDLLYMSTIPPIGMLAAKLMNTFGIFFLLTMAVVPVFGSAFFLVGVQTDTVLRVIGLVLATSATCAMIGTAISAHTRRSVRAIFMSYVAVLAFMGIGPIVLFFIWLLVAAIFLDLRALGASIWSAFTVGSPFGTLAALLAGTLTTRSYAMAMGYQAVVCAVCGMLAARGIRRPMDAIPSATDTPIDDTEELKRRRVSFPFYLIDPLRRKKEIEDGRNPMLVREVRWGLMNRSTVLVRVFYVSVIIYLIMGSVAFVSSNEATAVRVFTAQLVLTVLVAPALMANSLTKERELGNLDMLRLTLLRPGEIIMGKIAAGAVALSPLVLAIVCVTVPLFVFVFQINALVLNGLMTLVVCCSICLAGGLFASLISHRTPAALIVSYMINLTLFAGLPIAAYMLGYWWLESVAGSLNYEARLRVQHFGAFFSPISAFESNATDTLTGRRFGTPGSVRRGSGVFALISPYYITNLLFFTVIAAGLIAASVRGFARFRMQDR